MIMPCEVNVSATYNLLFNDASPPRNNCPFAEISLFDIILLLTFNEPFISTV